MRAISDRRPRRRGWISIAVAVAALAGSVAAPAATGPKSVNGATYTGTFVANHTRIDVSFSVYARGTRVDHLLTSNVPLYCDGGQLTPVSFRSASISGQGAFTSTGTYRFTDGSSKGKVGARLTITGQFASGGRESGMLTTSYVNSRRCSGRSRYSTRVS